MKKSILQIMGIILFFFLIAYFLTYPYELSYNGNDSIILLEDSYEKTSLEELINRKELNGKVLYIRLWEPFDTETKDYTGKELEAFEHRLDSLRKQNSSVKYNLYTTDKEGVKSLKIPIEEQINALNTIYNKYKTSDVALVYIADPDNDLISKKDDFRKWIKGVKEFGTPGYHMILNQELLKKIHGKLNDYLPYFLLADKQGNIVNYQAPWPQDTVLLYPQIEHLLAE